ncbi:MAG: Gldg family protein [Planctomycetes bacterium]|nr:Gldg family protein [Planctomycetota bacterium]
MAKTSRQKVGILKTDVELFGGFDMQTFQQKPRWAIASELEQQYEIVNVDPTGEYPTDIACLLVPQASSLEQEPMDKLQQWILDGHKVVLFEDPAPVSAWGTAADDQKGGMQARMMGGGGPEKGNWAGFQRAIGVNAPVGEVVWDLSYNTFPGGRISPEFVFVHDAGMSADSPITKGLQNVVSMLGGHVESSGADGLTFTPLLVSRGPDSTGEENGIVAKMDLFQFNPFGGGPSLNPRPRRQVRNKDLTLAARVTGKPDGDGKGIDLIYVADLDMIGNQFFQLRQRVMDPNVRFDNVTFALNCIDTLVGDDSLIGLRKRRPLLRKLTAVEEAQTVFEKAWQKQKRDAEEAAKTSLDEAQARLDEAVDKIKNDATLDAQAKEVKIVQVQQQENRKLELAKAQIEEKKERKLEEAQFDRDAARMRIHNSYRWITLALALLPGILLGLVTFARRAMRASAIVPKSRLVGSHGGK